MKNEEQLDIKGRLTLQLTDAHGEVMQTMQIPNMIVNSGRKLVADLFSGKASKHISISHVAVGTNNADSKADDTALGAEVFRKEVTILDPQKDGDRFKVTLTTELEFNEPSGSEVILQEAALFYGPDKNARDTIMYNRVKFAPVTKNENFKLTLYWEIIF